MLIDLGAIQNGQPRQLQIDRRHLRRNRIVALEQHLRQQVIAPRHRNLTQALRRLFHLLILKQTPHQLRARVFFQR